ncbi:MAG: NIPSNAP family protein [Verrucomicrobia bacterium]|nr:NIPSNAP family protein [Verrucomicrobiota bacterium]
MHTNRRQFITTSLAATATLATGARAAGTAGAGSREYYELRSYGLKPDVRLKAPAARAPVEAYLEKALLPALAKRGVKNVGVFTELKVDKKQRTSEPLADSPLWVLIPYASLETFAGISAELNQDPAVQKAGAAYLQVPKASPAFERIDVWLYRAFQSMPKMEIPAFAKSRTPGRVYEMRDYESHSEERALNKMAMFDAGETQLMRDLGMSPMFFGQAIAGPNLPHLRYITGAKDLNTHLDNWGKFGPDPRWKAMSGDPKWSGNTSKNTARFCVPTAYSEL